jgi:SAM-dependent methyltransferase
LPADFADHFSRIAGEYATYRPGYPAALFAWLATLPRRHELAWDAGTGSGQAATGLVPYFSRLIATDASRDQIARATLHPAIKYRIAASEASGIHPSTVDLVVVAQALHWFPLERFYVEVARVMAPGGAFAAWTYGVLHSDDPSIDQVLQQFYTGEIHAWWPPSRRLVETGLRTIPFPFRELASPAFEMSAQWTLPQLLGYVGTWSAVTRCREQTGQDAAMALARDLAPLWGNPEAAKMIRWPLSIRAGMI